jgi:hypothetical protein
MKKFNSKLSFLILVFDYLNLKNKTADPSMQSKPQIIYVLGKFRLIPPK